MERLKLELLKKTFESEPKVRLAYFFGSAAIGEKGPLGDYDFAVYFGGKSRKQDSGAQSRLITKLSGVLGTDKVDVAILDSIESPEFKYNVIKNGVIVFEKEPARVVLEPKILNEYFDFHSLLVKNKLTKAL